MKKSYVLFAIITLSLHAAPAGAEALLLVTNDQHSAYERTAQLVAMVDRLGAKNTARYFGEPAIARREQPVLKLKAAVLDRLAGTNPAAGGR